MTRKMSLVVCLATCICLLIVQVQSRAQMSAPCTGFPWTADWNQCFQNMMANMQKNTWDAINSGGNGGSGMSSSSKNGVSSLSMTTGKTRWTIRAFGVRLSSSSVGDSIVIQAVIGSPISLTKKAVNAEELKIDLNYPPDANIPPKWITVNVVNGPDVSDLIITRKKEVLVIQNP